MGGGLPYLLLVAEASVLAAFGLGSGTGVTGPRSLMEISSFTVFSGLAEASWVASPGDN